MKYQKYLPIAFWGFLFMTLFTVSCGKVDDMHREFFEKGETIYIAKADSLKLKGGLNRIELSWLLLSDPKIHKYKVYWNNRKDSIENTVIKTAEVDTVRLMLNDMKEGTYHFEIFTYDKVGNTSVVTSGVGKVYGERYHSSLLPRTYKGAKRIDDGVEFTWMQADPSLLYVEVEYENSKGDVISQKITKKEEVNFLDNFPPGGSFQYRSFFLPDTNALDTFSTAFKTFTVSSEEVNWNDYDILFGHHDYILGRNAAGELMRFPDNGAVGFSNPVRINAGWNTFNIIFSYPHAGGIIGRTDAGTLSRYSLNEDGVIAPRASLGGGGWQGFTAMFSYKSMLIIRNAANQIKRYPLNTNWSLTPGNTVVQGVESPEDYDIIVGGVNGIMARSDDGKLWNIPLDGVYTATAQPRRLIAEGWDQYNIITTLQDNLLCRTKDGDLWQFPMYENGDIGPGTQISNRVEVWNF